MQVGGDCVGQFLYLLLARTTVRSVEHYLCYLGPLLTRALVRLIGCADGEFNKTRFLGVPRCLNPYRIFSACATIASQYTSP